MAQNSKQRSASSASNKRNYQPERAHVRARRQVRPSTPHVLGASPNASVSSSRSGRAQAGAGRRTGSAVRGQGSGNPKRSTGQNGRPGVRRRQDTASGRSKSRQRGGILSKLLIALAVVVLLSGGFTALYFSNLFAINLDNIKVVGNEKLRSDYIVELAAVPDDSTFLRTDSAAIQARVLAEPWVQSVEVETGFPDLLTLRITEKPVAAVVDIVPEKSTDSMQSWIIAADGSWIAELGDESNTGVHLNAEEFTKIPKIKDVSAAVRPQSGVLEKDDGVSNALVLLGGFSQEMREMVASISAPDVVKTTLTLYNNVGVAFGAAEDIEAKEKAIATLLQEHQGTITFINVRVANRATYRSTE